jgi:hypothetical protein
MDTIRRETPQRILIIARPGLGREVNNTLAAAGYEVYRSPDAAEVAATVKRLRPDLVIIALDLPWYDSTAAARIVGALDNPVPIMLLDHTARDSRPGETSKPTAAIEGKPILKAVNELLRDSRPSVEHGDCPKLESTRDLYDTCRRTVAAAHTLRSEGRQAVTLLTRARRSLMHAALP